MRAQHHAEEQLQQTRQELEQTTRELARSVALLRATLEATTDGVLVLSAEGQLLHCNANFLLMWRLDERELPLSAPALIEQLCARARDPQRARRLLESCCGECAGWSGRAAPACRRSR